METLLLFGFAGLLVIANGITVQETLQVLTGFELDEPSNLRLSHDEGHCKCSSHGCWCRGSDDNVPIHAYFSVVEAEEKKHDQAVIDVTIFIGKAAFTKEFEVNRFEDFCETVEGKRFCFRIDIEDRKRSQVLKGCFSVSRPHKVDMGCFQLPLMTSEPDNPITRGSTVDINDHQHNVFVEDREQMLDQPVFSMEVSRQAGTESNNFLELTSITEEHRAENTVSRGHCMCCEHGCSCEAVEDGYKIVVILSVEEVRHNCDKHTIIQGNFRIGDDAFVKLFDVDKFESFCHREKGTNICFSIRARKGCSDCIRTCMRLTKPKRINLGCFRIPLLAEGSDTDS